MWDAHVNLAYYNIKSREYVSVSGIAHVTQDRAKPVVMYQVVKGMITGDMADIGEVRRVEGREL